MDEIIERVLAGEVDRFAEIIRHHQQDIWRIAAFALRDTAATEDLVQQVFVEAYLALGRFERGRDLGAWLRTIARNQVRKELRRSGRDARKRRSYASWLDAELDAAGEGDGADPELRAALRRCREALAPAAAEALERRYERAQGFEQIAAALERTVAATRQLLSRTRAALRQCIEKQRRMVVS